VIEFIDPLDRKRLAALLTRRGVAAAAYSLSGGHPSECYVLDHRGYEWVVYYSERGLEQVCVRFRARTWLVVTSPTCSGKTGLFIPTAHERESRQERMAVSRERSLLGPGYCMSARMTESRSADASRA
jgi:hypothetical protein